MNNKELRIRISDQLMKRYRLICLEKDLSLPKQTAELIRVFVEIQEENNKLIAQAKMSKKN